MKRRSTHESDGGEEPISGEEASNKKRKEEEEVETEREKRVEAAVLGEDLLFEVLKHADARSLARAACVSRLWRLTADDERLWEVVCTRHWANMGCGVQQLRSVVLALGGFRRLHSLYLLPLLKQPGSSSSFSHPPLPISSALPSSSSSSSTVPAKRPGSCLPTRWGKDEVNLSLSLLSIRYYNEKMNLGKR